MRPDPTEVGIMPPVPTAFRPKRVAVEPIEPSFWRSVILGRRNEWRLVVDGERCSRISAYEANAIMQMVDAMPPISAAWKRVLEMAHLGLHPAELAGYLRQVEDPDALMDFAESARLEADARRRLRVAFGSLTQEDRYGK